MHVLIIPSWYKTPELPLQGTFFEEQARMLSKKGCKVGIFYPDHEMRFGLFRTTTPKAPEDFVDNGIPTYYSYTASIIPRTRLWNYKYAVFRAVLKFRKYVKTHGKPDIIHAHATFVGGIIADAISKRYKIPFVLTEHYTGLITINQFYSNKTDKKMIETVFSEANRVIIVSNYFRDRLLEKYKISTKNIVVIPNVVNSLFLENRVSKMKSFPFHLLCIAFLSERKNHMLLLETIKKLKHEKIDVRLKVIGDGPIREKLQRYAIENNISSSVFFLGNQPRESIKTEIDDAHIVVSASAFETFGVTLIESLACGRPIVAIDSGGPRDIITPSNGILVAEHTAEALAEAVVAVIENYEDYDQLKISTDCRERYSEDVIYTALSKVYESALV